MTDRVRFLPIEAPLPAEFRHDCERASQLSHALDEEWFRHLAANALGDGETAFWALAQSGADRALLPLLIRRRDGGALVNYYATYYTPILSGPGAQALLPELLGAMRSRWPAVARWWFHPAAPDDAQQTLSRALRAAGLVPFAYFAFGNWHLPSQALSWEGYLKGRTSKMRSNIKRMTRKLVEESAGRLEILTSVAQVEEALTAYETVYASSWKKPEPFKRFMPGLVRLAAEKGWLRMGVAWLDGQPVAAQLWLICGGRAAIYKVAYDERFKEWSPGLVLTAHLMRHVLDHDRVHEVDYLMGDDEYKRTWMSERRERWGLVAYNPRTPAGLLGLMQEVGGRWVKDVRQRRIDARKAIAGH